MHCEQGMCTDQHDKENVYISRLKQMANVTKLSRIMIFYTIPILLGKISNNDIVLLIKNNVVQ